LSDAGALSYDFEQLEPSAPPPGNTPAALLARAAAEADQLRAQARAEGYAEGQAAGREEGLGEVAEAARALTDAHASLQALRGELVAAIEGDAIEFALALAGKILAASLQARPELIAESVQGALRRLGDRRRVSVLVNPADLELVNAALGAGPADAAERLELLGEERVARGGAIVRTQEGEVDASVQTQLERAREVALAELQAAAHA
jgi:flagellar assembly protein FliH